MTLLGMVAQLTQAGVRFVLIGGLAMRAHGSGHVTDDLDICYDPAPDNVRRLGDILVQWQAYLRGAPPGLPFVPDARQVRSTPVMTLTTAFGSIDVMDRVAGVGEFEAVRQASLSLTIGGHEVMVLDLPGLIAAKRAARRPKDLAQLPELEALLELRDKR